MALLQPAKVEQSAAKVGVFGLQGAGKTTTSALIAIGLSKTYHQGAAVAFMDTENGSDYLVPIFEAEGVPLFTVKSRSFKDMRGSLREAEQAKCCAYLVDSYSHPWIELVATFKERSKRKRLEFHHMDELKGLWRQWTDQFLNSSLHVVLSGRLGYVWDREEDDADGKGDLVKLGTKMKSESEAGYEPSLLIEMEAIQSSEARMKKTRAKQGSIVHHAYVLKDRWRTLNGRTFTFKDLNTYKAGDYKAVFDAFRPHFDQLAIGTQQRAVDGSRSSADLFDNQGQTSDQRRATKVQIACEELQGTLVALWPGQDAKSKALKQAAIEALFATRSWTAVESKSLEALEAGLGVLHLFEKAAKDAVEAGNAATEAAHVFALMQMCRDRIEADAREEQEAAVI